MYSCASLLPRRIRIKEPNAQPKRSASYGKRRVSLGVDSAKELFL